MDLSGLPQFTVVELRPGRSADETLIGGHLSHLRGVHNDRGWLYRGEHESLIADLLDPAAAAGEPITLSVFTEDLKPDVAPGAAFPWLDHYWQPYHLAMILAPAERWTRRTFVATPARYFRQGNVTGWQQLDAASPEGAVDLGVREGAWDHEHCELCNAHIGAAGSPEGYVDPADHWLCSACYAKYAAPHDVSFAAEA
jgi:hypothetical protein